MRFRLHCADKNTGKEFDFEVDADTIQEAEAKGQAAGMLVSEVVPVDAAASVPHADAAPPTEPPVQGRTGCKVCGRGRLVRRKVYRMSGAVVSIGYILLIPSIMGIVLNALMFILPALGLAVTPEFTSADRQMLVDADIPERIVEEFADGHWAVSIEDLSEMNTRQRHAVGVVQGSRGDKASASCCVGVIGGGAAGNLWLLPLWFQQPVIVDSARTTFPWLAPILFG